MYGRSCSIIKVDKVDIYHLRCNMGHEGIVRTLVSLVEFYSRHALLTVLCFYRELDSIKKHAQGESVCNIYYWPIKSPRVPSRYTCKHTRLRKRRCRWGFWVLFEPNRTTVDLSTAKDWLIIVGNFSLLQHDWGLEEVHNNRYTLYPNSNPLACLKMAYQPFSHDWDHNSMIPL